MHSVFHGTTRKSGVCNMSEVFTYFTSEEVAKHNTPSDCWIILGKPENGGRKVYNVTDFLDSHPGGRGIIMEYAGQDATILFEDIDHSPSAHQLLKKFFIGYLVEDVNLASEIKANTAIAELLPDGSSHDIAAVVNPCKYLSQQMPLVQCGEVDLSSRLPYRIQRTHQIPVTFSHVFPKMPHVAVFVNFVDAEQGKNTRIVANAMGISTSGFLLELGTYADSKLWKLRISWLASIHPSVQIVNLNFGGTSSELSKVTRVRVSYPTPVMMSSPLPTICVGMNHLDMSKTYNRRLKMEVEKVTNMDMTLAIHMWGDTVSWQVGVSVIILSDPSLATTLLPNSFQNTLSQSRQPQLDYINVYPKSLPMGENGLVTRGCVSTIPYREAGEDMPVVLTLLSGFDMHKQSMVCLKVTHNPVVRDAVGLVDNTFRVDLRATLGPHTVAYGVQYNALVLSRSICAPPQFLEEIQQD